MSEQKLTIIRCPKCGTPAWKNGRRGMTAYMRCPAAGCLETFKVPVEDPLGPLFPTIGKRRVTPASPGGRVVSC